MHRSLLALLSLLLLVGGSLLAQEDTDTANTDMATEPVIAWECPDDLDSDTLNVYNWATYIGENTISDFEDLCGVTVNYDIYDSNEALMARLRQGNPGYDVAFPNEYAIIIMTREGLLAPINLENIPNFSNIAERWTGLGFDPENEYSVPYLWGTFGVAVNTERVTEPIASWEDVWNHDGPVAWIEDNRSMLSVALRMLGFDPNSDNPEEVRAAQEYLLENSDNVVIFADDDGQTLLERGEVDIALEYSGDVYQLILECECDTYSYIIPNEGSVADLASMVIPAGAPSPRLAEAFIDYILDPTVNAQISTFTAYATPNEAAIESGLIPEEFLANPAISPSDEAVANLFYIEDVGDAQQTYNDVWDELKIFAGS